MRRLLHEHWIEILVILLGLLLLTCLVWAIVRREQTYERLERAMPLSPDLSDEGRRTAELTLALRDAVAYRLERAAHSTPDSTDYWEREAWIAAFLAMRVAEPKPGTVSWNLLHKLPGGKNL